MEHTKKIKERLERGEPLPYVAQLNYEGIKYALTLTKDTYLDIAKKELHQLENNIAFFSASKGNPLLEAALAKIEEQKALVEHYTAMRKLFNSLLK